MLLTNHWALVALLLGARTISTDRFTWTLSRQCNMIDASNYCNEYYNSFDAPLKSDLCLRASSSECTISYSTTLNFERTEMCTHGPYLWIDLAMGNLWRLGKHEPAQLFAVSANLVDCGNYTVASITDPLASWCTKPQNVVFHPATFYDINHLKIPNAIRLNQSIYLVIMSPSEPQDCWISVTK
ncbi:hypothetical protein GNI_158050 [Gregarina niphandrodes]|uniref:Transmembrane protein n=1 Tax=Gregarina niphandrodes TaxID=110365 RepID=A0A023AZ85_GRENI|nr:hypothetical protein GNI_158050 [Gregarina niphandrodes]EZG43798.1 hypothetical protein GNI_158050 [Gregarina niphandrodes]|eukprot:XP_011133008.1 hypothetical protein GNI_158050 [Gregarina niphandrodes]